MDESKLSTLSLEEAQPVIMGAEAPLHLTDDPLVAVAINNQYRRAEVPDGTGSGLWTVDQWRAEAPRAYRFMAPTFAPRCWGAAAPISQASYSTAFTQEFPELERILPMHNVCVAGGAAAWPLGESCHKAGDIDFFLYGLPADPDEASRDARWQCVSELLARIRAQYDMCIETLMPGLISIKAYRRGETKAVKLQIILRAYPSVSAILHGFDVPACCIAYDGAIARMTYLAAYAHMFRVNVVVPAYRSTTYERRLLKYFDRGYALVLPHLQFTCLARGVPTVLPNLILTPSIVRGRFAVGVASLSVEQPESDYDVGSPWRARAICQYGQSAINLRMLAAGKPLVVMAIAGVCRTQRHYFRTQIAETRGGLQLTVDLTLADICPRTQVKHALQTCARAVVTRRGHVNVTTLSRVFGLGADQIARLSEVIAEAHAANPGRRVDVSQSLAAAQAALLAKYDALPNEIAWWILADPTRQHTASINPRCEDPARWYGAAYAANLGAATTEELLELVMGAYESRLDRDEGRPPLGVAFAGVCPMCHDEVQRGDINSITLRCGHVFHWSSQDGCGGLYTWAEQQPTCPVCRTPFGDTDDSLPELQEDNDVPVVINIAL